MLPVDCSAMVAFQVKLRQEAWISPQHRDRYLRANELRETLKKVVPKQFEQIVIDILVSMGYGLAGLTLGKRLTNRTR